MKAKPGSYPHTPNPWWDKIGGKQLREQKLIFYLLRFVSWVLCSQMRFLELSVADLWANNSDREPGFLRCWDANEHCMVTSWNWWRAKLKKTEREMEIWRGKVETSERIIKGTNEQQFRKRRILYWNGTCNIIHREEFAYQNPKSV